MLIALLALLGTAADLVAPLIYREAVNDIAGLFVEGGSVAESGSAQDADPETREPHGPGYIAPRSFNQTFDTLLVSVLLLLAANLAAHFLQLAADQRTTRIASRIEADVISRTFAHALRLPVTYFGRRASAGVARQIDQLDQVSPIVTAAAHEIAPDIVRMAGVLAIMFTQSWNLSLVALITLPPYVWIVRRSTLRLERGLTGYYEMWEGISARIQEALGALKTVKLSGAENRETGRLEAQAKAAYAQYIERNRLGNFYLFWQTAVNYLSQALLLAYGGYLVLEGQLTPGDVVMFVAYLDRLFSPIESLSGTLVTLQSHVASFDRALALQRSGVEESGGAELCSGKGLVEFREVDFSYDAARPVLHQVSFTLPPGGVTALVGPSGAGKTTISDLLLRLFSPQGGSILIDGQDIAALDPASVRRQVGVVAADGAIFSGTLADNIRYKRPEASEAEIEAAALAAGLGATLARLPDGLATAIGERGMGLSVGERQRLQLARVLVSRPLILVLDEATANLDYATESDIRRTLLETRTHPTTLVIAHRFSMVQDADHVIVLEAGRATAQGTVMEVLETSPWFARFAAAGGLHIDGRRGASGR